MIQNLINRCHIGDCSTVMRDLIAAGARVQSIVTSPPYFRLRDYGAAGQIGLESTPEQYIARLVEVFALARNLLSEDGTLWLNMGDSYAGSGGQTPQTGALLKNKDMIGLPWMLAFALRADGWYLRQDIIWHKPNPMPESVTDRCTKAHEYLFLLSKSERYFFDHRAIKEPTINTHPRVPTGWATEGEHTAQAWATPEKQGRGHHTKYATDDPHHRTKSGLNSRRNSFARTTKNSAGLHGQTPQFWPGRENISYSGTRNKRSVWTVPTQGFSGAHFAVFPPALIEPCILAGSRLGDTVFDPFMGSGTTAQVAQAMGRHWLGCEINPDYMHLQQSRLCQGSLMLAV